MAGNPKRNHGKICGAHARSTGKPCQMRNLLPNGRCRLHGSGGPRTPEGKARAIRNLIEHRGPKTEEGRALMLAGARKGGLVTGVKRRKLAAERKAAEEFMERYARASSHPPPRTP